MSTWLWLGLVALAPAQDDMDALYDPAPPADSAFVRIVNAAATEASAHIGRRELGAIAPGAVSPYFVAAAGEHTVRLGAIENPLTVEAQGYYTVAPASSGATVVTDEGKLELAKATVVLYNFSALPTVELKTADGGASVVEAVQPGASGSRKVNGVTVDLAVFAGDTKVADLPQRKLERNVGYAVVVTGEAGERVTWARATTDAKR